MESIRFLIFTIILLLHEIPPYLCILNSTTVSLSSGSNILIDYADPQYIGLIKMKENPVNGMNNLFDISIEDAGNQFIIYPTVPSNYKMATYYDASSLTKRSCIARDNILQFYGPNQVMLHSYTAPTGQFLQIDFGQNQNIIYFVHYDLVDTYLVKRYSASDQSLVEIFQQEEEPVNIEYRDGLVLAYFSGQNITNSFVMIYNQTSQEQITIDFNGKYSSTFLQIPIYSYQTYEVQASNKAIFTEDATEVIFFNQFKLQLWNIATATLSQSIQLPGDIMTAIQCGGHILTIAKEINSAPILYDLSPTLSFIETIELEESPCYQLFCDENTLVAFPIQGGELLRIELTLINVVPQINVIPIPTTINWSQPLAQNVSSPEDKDLQQQQREEKYNVALQLFQNEEVSETFQIFSSAIPFISSTPLKDKLKFMSYSIDIFFPYAAHQINYTETIKIFSEEMDILSELRIRPQFLSSLDLTSLIDFQKQNQKYQIQLDSLHRAQTSIYFMQSVKGFYLINIPLSVCIFITFLIARLLMGKLSTQSKLVRGIFGYVYLSSQWWMLVVSIAETNLSFNVFYGFIQTTAAFSFNFWDKANIMLAIFTSFLLMLFAIAFYPLLYSHEKKNLVTQIVSDTKFHFQGFILISALGSLNNYIRSSIQAIWLERGILGLVFESFCLLILTIILRKVFRNMLIFGITVCVIISTLLFDLHLFLMFLGLKSDQNEIWSFGLILAVLLMSILRNLSIIFFDIKEFIQNCRKSNKIKNEEEPKKETKKVTKIEEINDDFISKRSDNFMAKNSISKKKMNIFQEVQSQNSMKLSQSSRSNKNSIHPLHLNNEENIQNMKIYQQKISEIEKFEL